jgi:hypothetical protein
MTLRVSLAAALAAASMALGPAPSHASVVIAEVAPQSGTLIGGNNIAAASAISFTTTSAFTDITISALFYSNTFGATGSGTAYLTNSIGPGTTEGANEVAKVSLTDLPSPFTTSTPETVFTGLSLAAGTYYVILANDAGSPGAGWGGAASPVVTTSPGVTIGYFSTNFIDPGLLADYSPASDFTTRGPDQGFVFSVIGSPASPVPEASTWAMMLIGFAGLGRAAYRMRAARR